MHYYYSLPLLTIICTVQSLPSLLSGNDGYLIKEYINAINAYGPGLGVYSPYSYVDISYDNIPFVGKIPIFGKEGTSSKMGISPFYPPEGNPSNPWPPLYRARPLPLHVPEPQDVVAVPLDEEALHGEPLFPPEMVLPGESVPSEKEETNTVEQPVNPFSDEKGNDLNEEIALINWPETAGASEISMEPKLGNLMIDQKETMVIQDRVSEHNTKEEDLRNIKPGRDGERPKSPFRSKRVRRLMDLLTAA